MSEHNSLYFRIKQFLRQNRIRDHTKYYIALNVAGEQYEQYISEWGYPRAQPDPASIPTFTHCEFLHVDEDSKTHSRDIYTGNTFLRSDGASFVMDSV
jgi:hypothetical protein